jgi:hypothetical protein
MGIDRRTVAGQHQHRNVISFGVEKTIIAGGPNNGFVHSRRGRSRKRDASGTSVV